MRARIHIGLLISLVALSCKSGGGSDEKSAAQLVSEGWSAYAAGDYSTATSDFSQAIAKDPGLADAYNGAGWSYAKAGSPATSYDEFTSGLSRDASNLDMRAGRAFASNAKKAYAISIADADSVLSSNASWSFSHDPSVSAADLHLLLAEDYFAESSPDYVASLHQVQLLNPSFAPDVSTVAGQSALAHEIERLRSVV